MNTAEYLNTLIECKEDMKSAIIEKGVTPTGGLSTYADAILQVPQEALPWTLSELKFAHSTVYSIDFNKIQLNTSNYTDMHGMFSGCNELVSVINMDTSNVTDMSIMFSSCMSMSGAPKMDTSNVTNMRQMFDNCQTLSFVPLYDASNVEDVYGMFESAALHNSITIMGLKNLGAKENLDGAIQILGYSTSNMFTSITKESVLNIINNLYDRASAGYSVLKIRLSLNGLSDEEKAIATNKGWILIGING